LRFIHGMSHIEEVLESANHDNRIRRLRNSRWQKIKYSFESVVSRPAEFNPLRDKKQLLALGRRLL